MNVAVPSTSIDVHGSPGAYEAKGTSGQPTTRRFCASCGAPLFTDAAAFSGLTFIKAGTLDDPSWIEPNLHIWCDSAQPWDHIPAGATCVGKNPPAT